MKLWGGLFLEQTHFEVEDFSSSLEVDARLWEVDIFGSIAHAKMLGNVGIIPSAEAGAIVVALQQMHEEFKLGKIQIDPTSEDIHSDIEKKLYVKVGVLAGKLHTARSRNDQVATDTRLYLAGEINHLVTHLKALQNYFIKTAEKHIETLLPGLTHMQHAQPVSLAHHLMAYFWMFQRDIERLLETQKRVLHLPLGSAALAGTGFPLNREQVAKDLNFNSVSENSLDAVSDRDYIIEFLSDSATIMMHLSRLSEELVLWSMPEFKFVELSDKVTTGSSIMPQKKNPDVAELIRGKVGRVNGALIGILTTLKALPLAYNRDLQEDKFHLFTGLDTVKSCARLMLVMLEEATWNTANMKKSLAGDFSNATDLADDLVKKGLPFREAHEVIGRTVQYCIKNKIALEQISLNELKALHPLFDEASLAILPHLAVMQARHSQGGTSPKAVAVQLEQAKALL
ncbi:MAG: argininosuccinate lyase [Pseudobdellovibrio sp.]|nr:argininosuccinate lyase [Pseudobdellovibrio sp.]